MIYKSSETIHAIRTINNFHLSRCHSIVNYAVFQLFSYYFFYYYYFSLNQSCVKCSKKSEQKWTKWIRFQAHNDHFKFRNEFVIMTAFGYVSNCLLTKLFNFLISIWNVQSFPFWRLTKTIYAYIYIWWANSNHSATLNCFVLFIFFLYNLKYLFRLICD